MRSMLRYLALALLVAAAACESIPGPRGEPCGGQRMVDAKATLPDTGIGAGASAVIGFLDAGPYSEADWSTIGVTVSAPPGGRLTDPPPRIRLVTDDGSAFLDVQSIATSNAVWDARQSLPVVAEREQLIAAAREGRLNVEIRDSTRVTRVKPIVSFAGTRPVVTCL